MTQPFIDTDVEGEKKRRKKGGKKEEKKEAMKK